MVFDKTGTLTRGHFHITVVHPEEIDQQELLRLAATLESASAHPISRSICEGFHGTLATEELSEIHEIARQGLQAMVQGEQLSVGNEKLLAALQIQLPNCPRAGTVIHVARGQKYLGRIVIEDELKPGAEQALEALRKEGITKTVMLTGDNEAVAQAVSQRLGISEYHAQFLPAQKLEQVERLLAQKQGDETLVFVGDGINDAPVLTRVDVGVSVLAILNAMRALR